MDCSCFERVHTGICYNEDGDTKLRVEYEAHKHNKLFPEDPNTSSILNVILRCSTLLGCDLFSERRVQGNMVFQGTRRNGSYIEGSVSSYHTAEINEHLTQSISVPGCLYICNE